MVYFLLNFAYLYILSLSGHWFTKRGRGFAEKIRLPPPPRPRPPPSTINFGAALSDTDCSLVYTRQYSQPCLYSMCLKSRQYRTLCVIISIIRIFYPVCKKKNETFLNSFLYMFLLLLLFYVFDLEARTFFGDRHHLIVV